MLLSVITTLVGLIAVVLVMLLVIGYIVPTKFPETAYWVQGKKDMNAYLSIAIVIAVATGIAQYNALTLLAAVLAALSVLLVVFCLLPETRMAEDKRIELGMMRLRRNAGLMGIFTASDDNL